MKRFQIMLLAFAMPIAAFAQSFAGKPFLSVQGHAETRVKPDVFPLEVTVTDVSMDPAKSQRLVEGLSKTVLAAADDQRLADTDLEVGNLSISSKTEWNEATNKDVFLGNEYQRKFVLRFHDLESLRKFLAVMPESRNLELRTRTFEYSKQRELQRKLRRDAIEDAKQGATDMAAAVGKRLLELQNVSDRAQNTVYSASGYAGLGSVSVEGTALFAPGTVQRRAQIVLREGEIKVSADAYLVYVIGD